MTSPLPRKRPTTRPSFSLPKRVRVALALLACCAPLAASSALANSLQWESPAAKPSHDDAPQKALRFRSPGSQAETAAWNAPIAEQSRPVVVQTSRHEELVPENTDSNLTVDARPKQSFIVRISEMAADNADELLADDAPQTDPEDRLAVLLAQASDEANPFQQIDDGDVPTDTDSGDVAGTIEEEIQRRARDTHIDRPPTNRLNDDDEFLNEILADDKPEEDSFDPFGDTDGMADLAPENGLDLPFGSTDEERRELIERERQEVNKNCEEEYDAIRSNRIDSISLDINVEGDPGVDYPFECGLGAELYEPRTWSQITYTWKASNLCHKPLYFEQVALERHGRSFGFYMQPILSGAHFFGTLPILPYKMGLKTPNECVYTLGHYRPGVCTPPLVGGLPFTWRAAGFMGGVYTGAAFIFP